MLLITTLNLVPTQGFIFHTGIDRLVMLQHGRMYF